MAQQQLPVAVQRQGKADRGGPDERGHDLPGRFISRVGHIEKQQRADHNGGAEPHHIDQRMLVTQVQTAHDRVDKDRARHAEQGRH